nr:immunoglobulin light chain junction region [Macaca mulatta]MPO11170.1 immunoglobulin light chain junction region [Macaca mulatta]
CAAGDDSLSGNIF